MAAKVKPKGRSGDAHIVREMVTPKINARYFTITSDQGGSIEIS
jgi:hypothetical protein